MKPCARSQGRMPWPLAPSGVTVPSATRHKCCTNLYRERGEPKQEVALARAGALLPALPPAQPLPPPLPAPPCLPPSLPYRLAPSPSLAPTPTPCPERTGGSGSCLVR